MESRFAKYENDGQSASSHIANVNSFIDFLNDKGNDIIEKEIKDLSRRMDEGNAPAIFGSKKSKLIKLGKCIEDLYETYHFGKNKADA